MKNIGCVIYTETNSGIKAEWAFSKNNKITHGTGIGIRSTESKGGFVGEYEITYEDSDCKKYPKLKLVISFELECYKLLWLNNGKTAYIGIGIENDNKLSAGWFEYIEEEH